MRSTTDFSVAIATQQKMRRAVRALTEEIYGNLRSTPDGLVAVTATKGTSDSTGDIQPRDSDTYYTYHTHPSATYREKQLAVGWPSVQDVEMVVHMLGRRPPEQILHVLFAVEGMYFMYFPEEFHDKALQLYHSLAGCTEFPCCEASPSNHDGITAEFCQVFDRDTHRDGNTTLEQYLSDAISHETVRIEFARWDPRA